MSLMTPTEQAELALAYEAARELLAQARDYLLRLPAVPATRELALRIDDHLTAPAGTLVRHVAETSARDATRLTWLKYLSNGEIMLAASLKGRTLTLIGDHLLSRPKAAQVVLEALDRKLTVELEPARDMSESSFAPRRAPTDLTGRERTLAPESGMPGQPVELAIELPFHEPASDFERRGWLDYLDGRRLLDNPYGSPGELRFDAEAWARGWDLARVAVMGGAFLPTSTDPSEPPGPAFLCASDYRQYLLQWVNTVAAPHAERIRRQIDLMQDIVSRAWAARVEEPSINVGEAQVAAFRATQVRQADLQAGPAAND